MKTLLSYIALSEHESEQAASRMLNFFNLVQGLEHEKRHEWISIGIPEQYCETTYEHSLKVKNAFALYSYDKLSKCDRVKGAILIDMQNFAHAIDSILVSEYHPEKDELPHMEEERITQVFEHLEKGVQLLDLYHECQCDNSDLLKIIKMFDVANNCPKAHHYLSSFKNIKEYYLAKPSEYHKMRSDLYENRPLDDVLLCMQYNLSLIFTQTMDLLQDTPLNGILRTLEHTKTDNSFGEYFRLLEGSAGKVNPRSQHNNITMGDIRSFIYQ